MNTGMSVWAQHALVVVAVMLSLGNANCFASCSPEIVVAVNDSHSKRPVSRDCHQHSSAEREADQQTNRQSHDGKNHSCLHDALITPTTDISSPSTIGLPVTLAFSASVNRFVPVRRLLVSDLSPPIRLHPNLTTVIRV